MAKQSVSGIGIDEFDLAILSELQTNGRIRNADLARRVHTSIALNDIKSSTMLPLDRNTVCSDAT